MTSRRRVVATAAHTAWATPVILAASAAPARASSVNGGVDVIGFDVTRSAAVGTAAFTLKNNTGGNVPPIIFVILSVTGTPGPSGPVVSGVAWLPGGVTTTPTGFTIELQYNSALAAGATSSEVTVTFTAGDPGAGSASATLTSPAIAVTGSESGTGTYT